MLGGTWFSQERTVNVEESTCSIEGWRRREGEDYWEVEEEGRREKDTEWAIFEWDISSDQRIQQIVVGERWLDNEVKGKTVPKTAVSEDRLLNINSDRKSSKDHRDIRATINNVKRTKNKIIITTCPSWWDHSGTTWVISSQKWSRNLFVGADQPWVGGQNGWKLAVKGEDKWASWAIIENDCGKQRRGVCCLQGRKYQVTKG